MQTSPRSFAMPSFGAVFGEDARNTHLKPVPTADGASAHGTLTRPHTSGSAIPFSSFHIHRDSRDSTSTTSSDNSPTTTISTMDSSSVTDPSPGPSPESPVAKTATSFVADFRSRRTEESSPSGFFELQRPTTPAKKPRNLKNLGINTSTSLGNLRLNPTPSLPAVEKQEKNSSAPPSPSFIKPPTPPRRRPSNLSLTISTPGSQENKPMRLIIPSTPSFNRPALRHFQSSPSLPLVSPAVGPNGGMQLPISRPIKPNTRGLTEVPYEMEEEEEQEPNFDVPQSREEKPAAYPNGPIQIYPSGVFLYFEPTAEQACTFDVIVNVASEVKNPFTAPAAESQKDIDARRLDGPPAENPDFASILDRSKPPSDQQHSSPTTPKATPVLDAVHPPEYVIDGKMHKTPEYIHMMWEHNTDIVSDLYRLVKVMDERVQQGKRVLVHCQCGVSRSASLIVAYGLYKNPGMSVQEAYDIVKKRSKWIGPNMNLIMQLQEFRNGLLKNDTRSFNPGFGRRSAGLPTGVSVATNRGSPFDRNHPAGPRTPRTAPLPPETDMNLQRASTGNMMAISPGPLSAPSGSSLFSPGFRQSWAASQTQFDLSPKSSPTTTSYVDPKGHIVPVLAVTDNDASIVDTPQPLTEEVQPQPGEHEAGLTPLPVPNFSRQLPLRSEDSNIKFDRPRTSQGLSSLLPPSQGRELPLRSPAVATFNLAPSQGYDLPLRSPAVATFTIPSLAPSHAHDLPLRSPAVATFSIPSLAPDHSLGAPLRSPTKPEFNLNPWPQGYDLDPYARSDSPPPPPLSPRTFEFGNPQPQDETPDSYESRYNRVSDSTIKVPVFEPSTEDQTESELISPVRTEFPADVFGRETDLVEQELTSPRAAEFHMTPLKPRVEDEDPFGLASPRKFEFPPSIFKNRSFAQREAQLEAEARRPSFQAILPPSDLAQPESVNGFASLNGTAQAPPAIQTPAFSRPKSGEFDARIDSVSPTEDIAFSESPLPTLRSSRQEPPVTPKSPSQAFLSTTPKPNGVRSRFSSPNLREQRKLHKLQTEMEAMLPKVAPQPTQTVDDLEALMSPRAEEFTRNPFHFDLRSPTDEVSPASSNETVKDGQNRTEWTEKRQWTPQKSLDVDPRSPVQTGSSPIVRNIWDVL